MPPGEKGGGEGGYGNLKNGGMDGWIDRGEIVRMGGWVGELTFGFWIFVVLVVLVVLIVAGMRFRFRFRLWSRINGVSEFGVDNYLR